MTQTLAGAATPTTRAPYALRATTLLSLLSGAALVVDCVTITVLNHAFGALDNGLFLTGFVLLLLAQAALAVYVSRRHRGLRRVAIAVGCYLAAAAVLGIVSFAFDRMGRAVFSPANIGLHSEWSFFSIGVLMLGLAAWAFRRLRR